MANLFVFLTTSKTLETTAIPAPHSPDWNLYSVTSKRPQYWMIYCTSNIGDRRQYHHQTKSMMAVSFSRRTSVQIRPIMGSCRSNSVACTRLTKCHYCIPSPPKSSMSMYFGALDELGYRCEVRGQSSACNVDPIKVHPSC